MEKIIEHIQSGLTKDEVGYLIRQTQKYRKRNGKVSRYYSHAYMYRDGYGYRKMYVRKSDVGAVSDSIQEAKKTLDREYRNTLKLINQFHNYEIIQERIWKELEMNPEKYTQRAVIVRLNQFALKN